MNGVGTHTTSLPDCPTTGSNGFFSCATDAAATTAKLRTTNDCNTRRRAFKRSLLDKDGGPIGMASMMTE